MTFVDLIEKYHVFFAWLTVFGSGGIAFIILVIVEFYFTTKIKITKINSKKDTDVQ